MAKTIIKTDAESLLPELKKALLIVPKNSPIPILENFMLDFRKGKSYVIANNLAQYFKTMIEAASDEEINFLVPAYLFTELIGSLSGALSIEVMKTKAVIKSNNGQYSISVSEAEDYPEQPKSKKSDVIVYDDVLLDMFLQAAEGCEYAISKEEIRPAMTGLFIEPDKNAKFVGTNGSMLALRIAPIESIGSGEGFIIPQSGLSILKKILPDKFKMTISEGKAFFTDGVMEFSTRLIGEKYPKYEAVIPQDNDKKVLIEKEELIKVIRRLKLFREDKGGDPIILKFSKGEMVLSMQNKSTGSDGKEIIECEHNVPDDFSIGFNPDALLLSVLSFKSAKINLTFSLPSKACVLFDQEKPMDISLIMPIRLEADVV